MIPKIIHYCWFGGRPLPDDVLRNIKTWNKYCPGYEIKEWNEKTFDVNCCLYVKQAYDRKKWAFVTDYVRLFALVTEGGIYMDTDVEVLKPLDDLLSNQAFSGFQDEKSIPTGIMASEPNYLFFQELLRDYDQRSFINKDGTNNTITNVKYITDSCLKKGLILNNRFQVIDGLALYPADFFCAKSPVDGKLFVNERTYTIHHFAGSWIDKNVKDRIERRRKYQNKYGKLGLLMYYMLNWPYKLREHFNK